MFTYPVLSSASPITREYFLQGDDSADQVHYGYYDLETGTTTLLTTVNVTSDFREAVAFVGDGSRFLTNNDVNDIEVWDYNAGTPTLLNRRESVSRQTAYAVQMDEANPGYFVCGPEQLYGSGITYALLNGDNSFTDITASQTASTSGERYRGVMLPFRNEQNKFVPMISVSSGTGYDIVSLDPDGASGLTIDWANSVNHVQGTGIAWSHDYDLRGGKYYFTASTTSSIMIYSYEPATGTIALVWSGAPPDGSQADEVAMVNGYLLLTNVGPPRTYATYSYSASGLVLVDEVATPDTTGSGAAYVGKYSRLVYRFRGSGFGRVYQVTSSGEITEHGTTLNETASNRINYLFDTSLVGFA
jgi:hypothetical protein